MTSYVACIERANLKSMNDIEVRIVLTPTASQSSWGGEFTSRSVDGILPNERLALTLSTGQKGTARVKETVFDSRAPETTLVRFTGMGALA